MHINVAKSICQIEGQFTLRKFTILKCIYVCVPPYLCTSKKRTVAINCVSFTFLSTALRDMQLLHYITHRSTSDITSKQMDLQKYTCLARGFETNKWSLSTFTETCSCAKLADSQEYVVYC